jgi:hypothetical protein
MPDEDERSEKRNGNAGKPMPGEAFLREPRRTRRFTKESKNL